METGGYRLKGISSEKDIDKPVVSIITVVYNSEHLIEKTIQSIQQQTYSNIEYVIIDGGSTDGTLEILKKYNDTIAYWISEPDKGLYFAMNKGLEAASGVYVWFINSGDQVYSKTTLENMLSISDNQDVIYGNAMIIDEHYQEIGLRRLGPPEVLTKKSMQQGMVVCHQAILAKRSLVPLYKTHYTLAADFDWVTSILSKTNSVFNTHQILCKYMDNGFSKNNIVKALKERFGIMVWNFGLFQTMLNHIYISFKFLRFLILHRRF